VSISLPLFEIYPPPMLMRTVSCCVRARGAAWEFFLWFRGKGPQGPVYYTRPTAMSFTSPPQALSYVVFTRPVPAPSPKASVGPVPTVGVSMCCPLPPCCHSLRAASLRRGARRECQPVCPTRAPRSPKCRGRRSLAKPGRGRIPGWANLHAERDRDAHDGNAVVAGTLFLVAGVLRAARMTPIGGRWHPTR
jgi:hypothetical protein